MMHLAESSRACARCRKLLTDAASLEEGIGPVCRQLDSVLLASLIPFDLKAAQAAMDSLSPDLFDVESVPYGTYNEVRAAVAVGVPDWRKTVKRIEWLLSWTPLTETETRQAFYDVARALGYIGLASLWADEAATGEAHVWLQEGRRYAIFESERNDPRGWFLFVTGPRNRAANGRIKLIQNRRFHDDKHAVIPDGGGMHAGWSVPASQAEAFFDVVARCYPNHTVHGAKSLRGLVEMAKVYDAGPPSRPVVVPPPAKPAPVPTGVIVRYARGASKLVVQAPRHDDFKRALNQRCGWDRVSFSDSLKAYLVPLTHEEDVLDLVRRYFGEPEEVRAA